MKHTICCLIIFSAALACTNTVGHEESADNENEIIANVSIATLIESNRIKIGTIQKQEMDQEIQCTGQLQLPPTAMISVHSKVSGQITAINFLAGDYVKRGNIIATVENPQLIEKQRKLLETKANLEFAKKDFERKKILKAGDATPEKTFEESQNRYELLHATYLGIKKELDLLGIDIETLESENQYQSAVHVFATRSGHVHDVMINLGQMVTTETPLIEISNTNQIHLELQVQPKDIGLVSIGQAVSFTVPNRTEIFEAQVIKINPMLQHEQPSLQVHCKINHPDKSVFVAGSFTNAQIKSVPKLVEGLPIDAIRKEGEQFFAYRVSNDEAVKTALTNAAAIGDFIVFDGDKSGQWIVEGAYYIE